jgi:hypothetical protein
VEAAAAAAAAVVVVLLFFTRAVVVGFRRPNAQIRMCWQANPEERPLITEVVDKMYSFKASKNY